jgi:hypothetical protein
MAITGKKMRVVSFFFLVGVISKLHQLRIIKQGKKYANGVCLWYACLLIPAIDNIEFY